MSKFPSDFDDDTTLPFINDNLDDIGGEAINALRDAAFALEQNIGLGAAGTTNSIADRLGVSINPNGTIKTSAIASMGLVTLPIRQDQIAEDAEIPESKLRLDHRTQDLFNYIRDLSGDVNLAIGWIATSGIKLEPHLIGAIYRHTMDQIDVTGDPVGYPFLKNKFRLFRDNLQSYNLVNDINNELLAHQWADGSPFGVIKNVTTNNGSVFPSNYGHTASGIFLNTTRFTTIPQTADDLQLLAEFIDNSSLFLLGTRIQNLYSNGISRASRSSSLTMDGYGQNIIPVTPAIAFLKNIGNSSSPFDSIDTGDDIIEFKPSAADIANSSFDEKFALVKVGDIIRINYGTIEVPFVIKEKKYSETGGKKYIVRIAGKNLAYAPLAVAQINRPLFNPNKFGVLAIAGANNPFSEIPSLIVSSPRGGEALGVGFSPDQFNESHYLIYLVLYPTGSASDGYTILPGIDVTGNQGTTPGLYTLDSIVEATNNAFRKVGYNYRFIAFSFQGEFGIMLAEPYGGAAFSIINAMVTPAGLLDSVGTHLTFPNNVVDMFPTVGSVAPDPLGFGPFGANIASPPFMTAYGSAAASQSPTKLFVPLKRNNVYINGIEREQLTLEVGQALDGYGDGYWVAQVIAQPGAAGRVPTIYRIPLDLSTSSLKPGKTIVVQSLGTGSLVDFGRFIIQSVTFGCSPGAFTDVEVYDAVHAKGFSPTTTIALDGYVALYFNSDSVSFNTETSTDFTNVTPFKRHFEVYIDQNGATFTHERGRFLASGASIAINSPNGATLLSTTELAKLDIIKISPKLRGYQYGTVNKITLKMLSYDSTTGIFSGFLAAYDGITFTRPGPTTFGKKGEVVRFYDETNIDFIDISFDININVSTISNQILDFQLFPTLSLDNEIMLIGTCQLNDTTKVVNKIRDERQFGNTSEKELSTSAFNFIALPERLLHYNGIIRGFEITNITNEFISLNGGMALVNGKFQSINDEIITIPKVRESFSLTSYPINWALCVNSIGELVTIPLADFDSVVGTPNAPTRIVVLANAVTLNTYSVDSTTFTNLIDNRKDLTILYIITSTVTGSGTGATVALTSRDVRRYVNDQDSCLPAVVTNDSAQGNFKDINTALNWLRFNNPLQSELELKGSSTVLGAFTFTGGQMSIFSGGSGALLGFNSSVNVVNFRFTDIPTTISTSATFSSSTFSHSSLSIGSTATFTNSALIQSPLTIGSNFTATNSSFRNGAVSAGPTATLSSVEFNNSPISVTGGSPTTLTDVVLVKSGLTVGASTGTTLLTTSTVVSSPITVSGTNGLEFDGVSIEDSIITVGGLAFIGVAVVSGQNIGTSFVDSYLTATNVTSASGSFNRTNVVSSGSVSTLLGRFTDSNLTLSAPGANLVTDTTYFENSTITIGGTANLAGGNFKDCTITITSTSTLLSTVFEDCTITCTGAATVTNVSFRNCNLTFTAGGTFTNVIIDPSTVTIGATITPTNVSVYDSTINVSAVRAFTLSNNFRFERNTVTWTGTPVSGFSAGDLVNSGNGFFWTSLGVSGSLSNVTIRNNTFNTALQNHFPFFAVQLTDYSAVMRTVNVSKNNFTSTAALDDVRAAIAVISTLNTRATVGVFPSYPAMIDVHFDDNVCNYNQMIIISAVRDATAGYMNGAGAVVTDTTINGNVCGTIAYYIASAGPFDGTNAGTPNNGVVRDKPNKLLIERNNCRFISNLDSIGTYICFRATNFPPQNVFEEVISTIGEASIIDNNCNWIQVGAGGYTFGSSGVNIIGNTVSPFNKLFLNNFTSHTLQQSVTPGNVGILLRREHNAIGASSSIISQNNLVQKYTSNSSPGVAITGASNPGTITITAPGHGFVDGQLVTISGVTGNTAANGTFVISSHTATTFTLSGSAGNGAYTGGGIAVGTTIYYYDAGIVCFNHCRITDNVIAGVINSTTAPLIYFWDIDSQVVTGNILERRGLSCNAYFYMDGLSSPGTAAQRLTIISNQLDALDSGSGTTNRAFIQYGTGTTSPSAQNGWLVIHNVAGNQVSGFTSY